MRSIIKYTFFFIPLFVSRFILAQDTEIMLIRSSEGTDDGIRILDNEGFIIFDEQLTPFKDTVWVWVEKERQYSLELSGMKKSGMDSVYLNVFVNDTPVLLIHSDVGPGDHSWKFFSGIERPVLRIVGGTTVSVSDYPWQVFVRAGNYLCGGTIIADKWVLTAAHCLFDEDDKRIPDEQIFFLAGTNEPFRPFPDGKRYNVIYSVVHEGYDTDNYENDLALLRTDEVINNSNTSPINFITAGDVSAGATDPGKVAIVTGWGLIAVDPDEFPDRLQKMEIPIVSESLARSIWGPLPANMLMAGYTDGRSDACSGDSGGPLIVNVNGQFKLAGVVSWGSSGCNTVGGYVRVSEFIDWLAKNTGVGQDQFLTVRAFGSAFRCQGTEEDPSSKTYFSDTLSNAISYHWRVEPEDAASILFNGTQAEITWSGSFHGEAYVSVRAQTPEGFTNWAGQRVVVSQVTEIFLQPLGATLCEGNGFTLSVGAVGSDLRYDWKRNGISVSSGRDTNFSFSEIGLKDIGAYTVEVSGGCGTVLSNPADVIVLQETQIVYQSGDQRIPQGTSLLIEAITLGDNLSYVWKKDGIERPDITSNKISIMQADANASGSYQVRVNGTCTSKFSREMHVYIDPGISDFPDGLNIWPTITNDEVNIALDTNEIFDVYIYNSLGVQLARKIKNRYKTTINLTHLSPDMYFIEIRLDKESKIYRVIKVL